MLLKHNRNEQMSYVQAYKLEECGLVCKIVFAIILVRSWIWTTPHNTLPVHTFDKQYMYNEDIRLSINPPTLQEKSHSEFFKSVD